MRDHRKIIISAVLLLLLFGVVSIMQSMGSPNQNLTNNSSYSTKSAPEVPVTIDETSSPVTAVPSPTKMNDSSETAATQRSFEQNGVTVGEFEVKPASTPVDAVVNTATRPSQETLNDLLDHINLAPTIKREGQAPVAGPVPGTESYVVDEQRLTDD